MKHLFIILGALCIMQQINAQVSEDWVSPEVSYLKNGKMITVDADDNVYTVSDIWHGDIYLTKRDKFGNILWTATYDNTTASQWEVASWVTMDPFGDVIVTGYTNSGFGSEYLAYQMVTMKFNGEDGELIWRKTYKTGSGHRGRRCLTDADGNIYVGGDLNATNTSYLELGNMVVKKYDTNGNIIWSVSQNELGALMAGPLNSMKFDNAGNLIIAGTNPQTSDVSAAKIDVDGNVLWSKAFDGYGVSDIASDASGNIFILYAYSFGTPVPSTDIAIRKISSAGTELWLQNYNIGGGSAAELGRQIECDNAGNLFVSAYGTQLTGMPYVDILTFKIDDSGNIIWQQRYNEHANNDEWPWMMVKDTDDNIYITGSGGPYPGGSTLSAQQMITIKYDTDGNEKWVALHYEFSAVGKAICLASDNSIFVAGQGSAVTIHYTQTEPASCSVPAGLFTSAISTTKARLNWSLVPDADQYEIWYKKSTAATWKKKFASGTLHKLNIKNLSCNTNYVWQMRTICDSTGVDLVSDFSAIQNFTTALCREGEFVMEDDLAITVYPNPATDQFTVAYVLPENTLFANISIYDLNGEVLYQKSLDATAGQIEENINTSNYPSGLYFVKIMCDDLIQTQKVLISK